MATPTKLAALRGRPLLVDTGDPAVDASLAGYLPVITGYRETTMYRIGNRPRRIRPWTCWRASVPS